MFILKCVTQSSVLKNHLIATNIILFSFLMWWTHHLIDNVSIILTLLYFMMTEWVKTLHNDDNAITEVYKKQESKYDVMKHNSNELENNEKENKKWNEERLSMTSNEEQNNDEKTDENNREDDDEINKNKKNTAMSVFAEQVVQ